jgi:ubiquitin carboxyl-terminal hydrolase 25/28
LGISEERKSDPLRMEYAMEISEGKIALNDLEEAYTYFSLDRDDKSIDEQNIIGVFQSRLDDAPKQEPQMRQALSLIGKDRKSDRIVHVATRSSQAPNRPLCALSLTLSQLSALTSKLWPILALIVPLVTTIS